MATVVTEFKLVSDSDMTVTTLQYINHNFKRNVPTHLDLTRPAICGCHHNAHLRKQNSEKL